MRCSLHAVVFADLFLPSAADDPDSEHRDDLDTGDFT
jgi:hypothetical protein